MVRSLEERLLGRLRTWALVSSSETPVGVGGENWVPGSFPGPAEDVGLRPSQVYGLTAKRLLRTGGTPDSLARAS